MRFAVDDEDLCLILELDAEPATVDLTRDGLGERLLAAAVEELIRCHARQESPDGHPWAALAVSTVRQKGSATIGVRSGRMLDPDRWKSGPRDLEPRRAFYWYPYGESHSGRDYGQAVAFHRGNPRTGQPARPLLGWTARAQEQARALVQASGGEV
jgi:hypothetical protein